MRVSAIHARALLEAAETRGVRSDELLARAGFAAGQFANPYGVMSVEELDRLTRLALDMTGDSAFGLHWGVSSPMFRFDVIALVVAQAPSLRAGLEVLLRCQAILGDHREFALEEGPFRAAVRVYPLAVSPVVAQVRTELALSGFVRFLGYVGADVARDVRRVDFAYARPQHVAEYERVFGKVCRFGQRASGFEFDRAWLDRPLPNANPELHQLIVAQCERVLGRVEAETSLAEKLRGQIRMSLPALPSMGSVARSIGMSERSLRRRLAEEGASYSALVKRTQCELAEALLQDRGRTIQQVAAHTGFKSVTAFHRAFKRQSGASPAAFRAR